MPQHLDCEVHDPGAVPVLLQVSDHADEAKGVHLEEGRGGYDVADGPVHRRPLSEVVDAWRVQQYKVGRGHDLTNPRADSVSNVDINCFIKTYSVKKVEACKRKTLEARSALISAESIIPGYGY